MSRVVAAREAGAVPHVRSQYDSERRRWLVVAAVGALSFLLILSRRPDALLDPQFLAEDGAYFYAQAYNLGAVHTLILPVAGYLVTSARIVGLIAMFFPVSWGPAIFNVLAILIQSLPAMFLCTDRFDQLIPNWYARMSLAFVYLVAPNTFELHATMTNSQWHLALLAFLVVIAAPRSDARWKIFDGLTLAFAGLSGPFCILLAPVILLRWLQTRTPFLLRALAIDLIAAVLQGATLIVSASSARAHAPPGIVGINGVELARIVAGQVFVAASLSARGYYVVATAGWWATEWFPILLVCAGVTFLGLALRRAPAELRLLWLFGALVFAASLFSPVTDGDGTYWQRLAHPMWNMRYEYLLTLAWLTTLVWTLCASSKRMLRYPALLILALTCFVAIPRDWEDPPFVNYHYQSYAQRVEQAPAGSRIVIPLNPGGFGPGGWTMTLIKQ